jgi:hypothetical protein
LVSVLLVGFCLAFVDIRDTRGAALAGLWLGLAVLTRSMTLPLLLFAVAILLARRQVAFALTMALPAVILIVPMGVWNYARAGVPWATRSGINLYIGNSPYSASLIPTHDLDLLEVEAYERFIRARPELPRSARNPDAEFDVFLTREAVAYILADPAGTVRAKIANVAYQLSPILVPWRVSDRDTRVRIEENGASRVVNSVARPPIEVWSHAVTRSVLLFGTIAGVWRRRRRLRADAVLWAVCITFVGINALYVPATRYTSPMLFVMMFYTAVALDSGAKRKAEDGHFPPGWAARGGTSAVPAAG